jgi:hypothetical protein
MKDFLSQHKPALVGASGQMRKFGNPIPLGLEIAV